MRRHMSNLTCGTLTVIVRFATHEQAACMEPFHAFFGGLTLPVRGSLRWHRSLVLFWFVEAGFGTQYTTHTTPSTVILNTLSVLYPTHFSQCPRGITFSQCLKWSQNRDSTHYTSTKHRFQKLHQAFLVHLPQTRDPLAATPR
jgi:hypothetical protein